ncbi:MAG: carbohydrate ABC transporter permease [Clostridia bacterium]
MSKKNPNKIKAKKTMGDYVISIVTVVFMTVLVAAVLYPFLNALAISLNDADDTVKGGITIFPRVFTVRNYELIFQNDSVYKAYIISIARTVIGTVTGLIFTGMLAFGLSRTKLEGRKFYTMFCLIPMYFSGGLMPTYFLIVQLGLRNNFLVYIIPVLVNLWNMILMRSYFASIPEALEESARIDGANYLTIFLKIFIPISQPIIATIALYIGVYQWNDWFTASIYITNADLKPMQSILISIVNEASFAEMIASVAGTGVDTGNMSQGQSTNIRSITMATMIVTILPIVMVYPFLQKYFIKGIMIGSVKG